MGFFQVSDLNGFKLISTDSAQFWADPLAALAGLGLGSPGAILVDTVNGRFNLVIPDSLTGAPIVTPTNPGTLEVSLNASQPVTEGQLLESDGTPNGVRPSIVAGGPCVGVARETITAPGPVRVTIAGLAAMLSGAAIAPGDELTSDGLGSAVPYTPATVPVPPAVVGSRVQAIALSAAGGAGTLVAARLVGGGLSP